jgi:hypothetical protein
MSSRTECAAKAVSAAARDTEGSMLPESRLDDVQPDAAIAAMTSAAVFIRPS